MQGYEYQSEFARKYYNEGREEGLRAAVLALAQVRLAVVTADDRAAIEEISDERALTELVEVLGRPDGASEARAIFERRISGGSLRK